jgi:peptidoglycan/xylan/chitin deacetylase (PgdA/CDA1 family)
MRSFLRNTYLGLFGSFRKPSPGVHIINSHFVTPDIPSEDEMIIMDDYLSFLSQYCKLITIQEATLIISSGKIDQNQCMVAFTFDDGFEECHTVIAPTLEKYGCNAAFFINSNYIESDKSYQNNFNRRINTYTKKPMTWDQVTDLHNRGHVIGAHTLDHLNLAELNDLEIENQLVLNKNILEKKLNYQCDYFAWTYGQFHHFPERALKITQKYHKFIFSGTDYKNYLSYHGAVINRRHIEAFWPKSHIRYFLATKKKYV